LGTKESSSSAADNLEQCQQESKVLESHVQGWRQSTHHPQELQTTKES
jgi:hypothetical protein